MWGFLTNNQPLLNSLFLFALATVVAWGWRTRDAAIRRAENLVREEKERAAKLIEDEKARATALVRDAEMKAATIHEKSERTQERLEELERQLGLFGQTILPISAAFQAILVKQLTHLHTPVLDALLKKLGPPYDLTDAEFVELETLLAERVIVMDDQIDESERDAATMLPLVMRRVKAEFELLQTAPISLQMVTVAPASLDEPPPPPPQEDAP